MPQSSHSPYNFSINPTYETIAGDLNTTRLYLSSPRVARWTNWWLRHHPPGYAGIPEVRSPSGFETTGTNPRWRWFFYFKLQTKSDDFRSFGPKSDDFKISEVGKRLFKILRWKLDFFGKNIFLRILGQKPTKREFWNFRKNFEKTFFLEHSRKNIFEKSRFIKKYLVSFYKRNMTHISCCDGRTDRRTHTIKFVRTNG